jgi:hypothetical protein
MSVLSSGRPRYTTLPVVQFIMGARDQFAARRLARIPNKPSLPIGSLMTGSALQHALLAKSLLMRSPHPEL